MHFAFSPSFGRIFAIHVVFTAIPKHHCPASILTFRNNAFEGSVFHRMIFHLYCQMLGALFPRQSFRHCPRFQHSFHLEAEIVMQPAGIMLLNHKPVRAFDAFWQWLAGWFSGFAEIPFTFVFGETHRVWTYKLEAGTSKVKGCGYTVLPRRF